MANVLCMPFYMYEQKHRAASNNLFPSNVRWAARRLFTFCLATHVSEGSEDKEGTEIRVSRPPRLGAKEYHAYIGQTERCAVTMLCWTKQEDNTRENLGGTFLYLLLLVRLTVKKCVVIVSLFVGICVVLREIVLSSYSCVTESFCLRAPRQAAYWNTPSKCNQ